MEQSQENTPDSYNEYDSIINNIVLRDEAIYNLASYYITKGYTKKAKNMEEIIKRFAEFKMLINRGSFTLSQLQADIYIKYGAPYN
jgi:hypothetical protein